MIYKSISRLRLAKTALRTPLNPAIPVRSPKHLANMLDPVVSPFRVLPHELDLRDHLPNYGFFRFAEMSINKWAYTTGVDNRADYNVWILAATQVVYLRQIKAMQRFHVKTQVMHWDKKYAYFQHEFILQHGKKNETRAAILISKLVFSANGKQTPPAQILGDIPVDVTENAVVASWLENQAAMKAYFS